MRAALLTLVTSIALAAGSIAQDTPTGGASSTVDEITARIHANYAQSRMALKSPSHAVGEYLFASNGALLEHSAAGATREFDLCDLKPKHIHVVPLVEGKAAVAMYYAEGSIQLKGRQMIRDYGTRASQTYVKVNGEWQCRTEHYSAMTGASGVVAKGVVNSDSQGDASKVRASARDASVPPAPMETETTREIKALIFNEHARSRANLRTRPGATGHLVFHSDGGFMQRKDPLEVLEFDIYNVNPTHIQVVPLVEGKAAVAMYYSTGSMKMKGFSMTGNYRVRVSQTFVKEFGRWKRQTAHWSPMQGAEGFNTVPLVSTDQAAAPKASGNRGHTKTGPEIDLAKHALGLYVAGDIDAWRACFSGNATFGHNRWGTNRPIGELAKIHKAFHEQVEDLKLTLANFEMVTVANGNRHVHAWLTFHTEYKSGEKDETVVFVSWGVNGNNKFWYENAIYDTAGMPDVAPYKK
ncbi:MAG: hypothetical protein CMJ90_01975 [Planctomycetes bacterium]|nr:hypothetical protein [Planctomycetota bacterium]